MVEASVGSFLWARASEAIGERRRWGYDVVANWRAALRGVT
ncbi:MAG TPA: hypothetical protein VGJ87_02615 [Roseiflexaceae bacterium]